MNKQRDPREVVIAIVDPFSSGHHMFYAITLTKGLKRDGYNVYVIGSETFTDGVREKTELDGYFTVSVTEKKLKSKNLINRIVSRISFINKAIGCASRCNADIIHFIHFDPFVFPFFIAVLGKMIINLNNYRVTIHSPDYLLNSTSNQYKYCINKGKILLLKLLTKRGLILILHSKILVVKSIKVGLINCKYAPYPAINVSQDKKMLRNSGQIFRARIGIPQEKILLLAFGGTRYNKGADLGIQALRYLPDNIHLLIAGKEECFTREYLLNLAEDSNVFNRVWLYLGFVPDEEVPEIFSAANAIILPYRKGFTGQSGPLTIAASIGLPVITSNELVLHEMVIKYKLGYVFSSENIHEFVLAVKKSTEFKNYYCPNTEFIKNNSEPEFVKKVSSAYFDKL